MANGFLNDDFNVVGAFSAGSLQNTPIGSTTRSTGAFTTLSTLNATPIAATLENNDTGGSSGPLIDLYRNSASPAGGDFVGGYRISAENSIGSKIIYSQHLHQIINTTSGSEDGSYTLQVADGGGLRNVMKASAGNLTINGTIDGTTPPSGAIGQLIKATGAAAAITSNTTFNVTSIILTAGVWEVSGKIVFRTTGTVTGNVEWISLISATTASLTAIDGVDGFGYFHTGGADAPKPILGITNMTELTGAIRIQVSTNTTYFLNGRGTASTTFTGVTAAGTIKAVRVS